MSEKLPALPKAQVGKSYFNWLLWLIPIAAALLCVWFVGQDIIFAGPTITIYFENADGLQGKNSQVKYLGVTVGEIRTVKLAKDRQHVAVTVQLDASVANLARQGAIFWIVRPQVELGALSGLQTIVSGNYITVQPGDGARTNEFIGAEKPQIKPVEALYIRLLAPKRGSLQPQSPIFYRDIQVGEVLDCRLGDDARDVIVQARILEEYAPLVRVDSIFWNAGGINIHVGLFSGANISAESAQTLISGGIAFATPTNFQNVATNGTVFTLQDKFQDEWLKWSPAIPLHLMPEAATYGAPSLDSVNPRSGNTL